MEWLGVSLWTLVIIGGPILLGLLFVYGIVRRRRRLRQQNLGGGERLR